jgi:hypothetical protein
MIVHPYDLKGGIREKDLKMVMLQEEAINVLFDPV